MKNNISWVDEKRAGQQWLRTQKLWDIASIALAFGGAYLFYWITHP
jgi:hypothetical protein